MSGAMNDKRPTMEGAAREQVMGAQLLATQVPAVLVNGFSFLLAEGFVRCVFVDQQPNIDAAARNAIIMSPLAVAQLARGCAQVVMTPGILNDEQRGAFLNDMAGVLPVLPPRGANLE